MVMPIFPFWHHRKRVDRANKVNQSVCNHHHLGNGGKKRQPAIYSSIWYVNDIGHLSHTQTSDSAIKHSNKAKKPEWDITNVNQPYERQCKQGENREIRILREQGLETGARRRDGEFGHERGKVCKGTSWRSAFSASSAKPQWYPQFPQPVWTPIWPLILKLFSVEWCWWLYNCNFVRLLFESLLSCECILGFWGREWADFLIVCEKVSLFFFNFF